MREIFDFVIVGAGSAGCVLAARLSRSGRHTVLLLEAGRADRNPYIHLPMGYPRLFADPSLNWMYESEPEPALDFRTLYQPRGKVLGGTSSINGMVYIRGTAQDYDGWAAMGHRGWSWNDVLPYFRRAQDQVRGESELHGVGGPLPVSEPAYVWDISKVFLQSCREAGLPENSDFNGPCQEGYGVYQTTTKRGRRMSAAAAYLKPARRRPNLIVRTGAFAAKILFEGTRATGIEYIHRNERKVAAARGEVILSGGAFNSPQILLLSGIGPADELAQHGIATILDRPGVGRNLQDHFQVSLAYRCGRRNTLNDFAGSPLRQAFAAARYALARRGPLAGNGLAAAAFVRSDPGRQRPDLNLYINPGSAAKRDRHGIVADGFSGFTLSPVHMCPQARGSVTLRSSDPTAPPTIRFGFLQHENDMRAMISGMRWIRKLAAQPAWKAWRISETAPGIAVDDDKGLEADLRARGFSNMHAACTCAMGSVVDTACRVIGIDRLRVVDASVMPAIIHGNTNAPTIMIAEKASDIILADAQRS